MNRRMLFLLGVLFSTATFAVADKDKDDKHDNRGGKHGRREDDRDDEDRGRGNGQGRGYFRQEDAEYLRQYYGGPRDLPPGLRKKYYRTGKLPPGWEQRFRPFPPELIQRLPPAPPYAERGYVDGVAVVYDRRTRVILDVIDLMNSATRR